MTKPEDTDKQHYHIKVSWPQTHNPTDEFIKKAHIYLGYPAKRALSAMRKHGG